MKRQGEYVPTGETSSSEDEKKDIDKQVEKKAKDQGKKPPELKIESRKETSTNNLIMHLLDHISKQEKLVGPAGKRGYLSSKQKNQLVKDFLDLRAAPHKNRFYQQVKAQIEDKKNQKIKEKQRIAHEERLKQEIFEFVFRPAVRDEP